MILPVISFAIVSGEFLFHPAQNEKEPVRKVAT